LEKFPDLPADLSLGSQLLKDMKSQVYKGQLLAGKNTAKGNLAGKTRIYLHEKGIRIKNELSDDMLDIHHAQIIRIEKETGSFQKNSNLILRILFRIVAILTLGVIFGDLSDDRRRKTRISPCLVIQYWDQSSKSANEILISGSEKRIERFVKACHEMYHHDTAR